MKVVMNNSLQQSFSIGCNEKYTDESVDSIFCGFQSGNHRNWKKHTYQMIPKLGEECCEVRSVFHHSSTGTFKTTDFE